LAYLHWRKLEENKLELKIIADVIALHHNEQQENSLRIFGEQVLRYGSVDIAIEKWLNKTA